MRKQANSFTFSTIVFIILGLIVPIWPISLPFFWYLAYRSYKRGDATALGTESQYWLKSPKNCSHYLGVNDTPELVEDAALWEAWHGSSYPNRAVPNRSGGHPTRWLRRVAHGSGGFSRRIVNSLGRL